MTDLPTPRVLADFAGPWRFVRVIDQADGAAVRVTGLAQFDWEGRDLAYLERGTMHLPNGQSFHAERRYTWREGLNVYFEDGRFFHSVPPQGGEAAHWCAPDDYRVAYDFGAWPQWRAVWTVRGPAKDYVMTTDYNRA